jgi:hypothetical protein
VQSARGLLYSWRSASIGFSREAFKAGKKPETTPTFVVQNREELLSELKKLEREMVTADRSEHPRMIGVISPLHS